MRPAALRTLRERRNRAKQRIGNGGTRFVSFLMKSTYTPSMEYTLCDISAFRYHRIPPQVIMLCPPLSRPSIGKRQRELAEHPLASDALGLPLHLLADDRRTRSRSSSAIPHVLSGELPAGSVQSSPLGMNVTSPLLTLFQMARHLPEAHLVMALYEFCGWFGIFKPTERINALLREAERNSLIESSFGWRRVKSTNGNVTSLWKRPPLIDLDELQAFARDMQSIRGGQTFLRAARSVTGIAASPFEVQTSILLSLPRSCGGEGFAGLANNRRISLSPEASRIAGKSNCYADILFNDAEDKPLIIECQGKVAHDSASALISDSDRTTALQHMGYDVMLLTYSQISHYNRFDIVRRDIAQKIGKPYLEKGARLAKAEQALRRDLFIDWNALGTYRKR